MRKDRRNSAAVLLLLILFILIFFLSQILLQKEEDVYLTLPQGGDLAVIGGSTAALISALEGIKAGAQVFVFPNGAELLEDTLVLVSEGLVALPALLPDERYDIGTIDFSAEELEKLIEINGKGVANPQLLEGFVQEADTLSGMALEYGGITFDLLPNPETEPYLHFSTSSDAGRKFKEYLLEKCRKEGVVFRSEKIKEIVLSPKETRSGVQMLLLENEEDEVFPFYIQGVILADGGYSGDILRRHEYLMRNNLLTLRPDQKGEGIRIALSLGAGFLQTSYLGFRVFLLQPQTGQLKEILPGDRIGAFFFNSEGRIMEGEATLSEITDFILRSPEDEVFFLTTDVMEWEYSRFFDVFDSLDGVMANFGLKEAAFPRSLYQSGVYYTASVNAGVYYTPGGLSVTPQGEVKNVEGGIIPGLYAAGEITGGLHGEGLLPGMALSETLFSARRAGRSAAEYARR